MNNRHMLTKFRGRVANNARVFMKDAEDSGLLFSHMDIKLYEATFDFISSGKKCSISFYEDGEIMGEIQDRWEFRIPNASKCLETVNNFILGVHNGMQSPR